MAEIVGVTIWILAAIRWGDWRNWEVYQPTIVYYILCDVLYYYISYDYPLWQLKPTWPLHNQLVSLVGELLVFTCTVLIYIGRFPSKKGSAMGWIALWVFIYTANEWVLVKLGVFVYHHGWGLFQSFLFSILTFVMLRFYYTKPVWALFCSVPIGALLILINSIPLK